MKKYMLWSLVFLLLFTLGFPLAGIKEESRAMETTSVPYDLALYIGSPLTLSEKGIQPLDPDNPNVAPLIYKNRTLVPLRAIAEHFGAEVSYDGANMAAIIQFNNLTYTFYAGKNYYLKTGLEAGSEKIFYDTEMLIRESRSMVPLRVITENVLGKKIDYSDQIIVVSGQALDLAASLELKADIKTRIGQAVKITSLAQLEKFVAAKAPYAGSMDLQSPMPEKTTDGISGESAVPPTGNSAASATEDSAAPSPDFSTTNNQVQGVDEADIVKTDGKFIYVAGGSTVKIVEANNGKMKLVDTIKAPAIPEANGSIHISELYIDEGRLVLLGSFWRGYSIMQPMDAPLPAQEDLAVSSMAIYPPIWQGKSFVYCGVYSISSTGEAELLKEVSVEGSLLSSRKTGDTLYLMANKYIYSYYPGDPREIVPLYQDSASVPAASQESGPEFKELPIDKIMCYPESPSPNYLMIAAIDIRDKEKEANIEAILGSGSTVYMNQSHLYIGQEEYSDKGGPMTSITKFSIIGTKIGFNGGGKVEGTLLNQFAMDEHEGNLRVATTGWNPSTGWGSDPSSSVYVLDPNLNQIGALENLAPGERIFAVRFMGDKGYLVTFRQVDPLFVLDLEEPDNPRVTGELKVPGFSNFLFPVAENVLLGVGQGTEEIYSRDASGKEIAIGTRQTGIKFSLFDVSDEGKPKELHAITIGESGSYSEILYNHKALMLHASQGILGFDATLMNTLQGKSPDSSSYFNGAVILAFDPQEGFDEKGRIAYKTAVQTGSDLGYYANVRRLCYIGSVLYYVQDNLIRSFDMETLAPISSL